MYSVHRKVEARFEKSIKETERKHIHFIKQAKLDRFINENPCPFFPNHTYNERDILCVPVGLIPDDHGWLGQLKMLCFNAFELVPCPHCNNMEKITPLKSVLDTKLQYDEEYEPKTQMEHEYIEEHIKPFIYKIN